ncbi:TetR/AcrR family transcriptional regulator [Myxococcus sp. AB025B]|uniref:TetR/AcrR family transcriptional regulator n=1 Tax=Myxococcus TaxID=32 RepID=UPI001142BAB2|nr:TetR/AcrR family transcriptional regulator [Myxococcus sp. AB025B]
MTRTKRPATEDSSPLRADAQRNRERLLAAAEEVFLEQGADASLDDVAKRAEVGIGTLYRRFPTREALVAAMFDDRLLSVVKASRERDKGADPSSALRSFLHEFTAHTNVYRGLAASLGTVLRCGTPGGQAIAEEGQRLLERAQQVGAVRRGVSFDDLVCVTTAVSLATSAESSKASIVRLVNLFLDGIVVR